MRIIERGTPPDDVPWKGQCIKCRSVLEALKQELNVEWDDRERGEFGRATCPVCKSPMVFYPTPKGGA